MFTFYYFDVCESCKAFTFFDILKKTYTLFFMERVTSFEKISSKRRILTLTCNKSCSVFGNSSLCFSTRRSEQYKSPVSQYKEDK